MNNRSNPVLPRIEWYLFYHRMGQGKTGYDRQVCCDKLDFAGGRPVAIVPSGTGGFSRE